MIWIINKIKVAKEVPDGWILSYEEVSNNVYIVRLKSEHGSMVEMTGVNDFEGLVTRSIESAKEIDKQLGIS